MKTPLVVVIRTLILVQISITTLSCYKMITIEEDEDDGGSSENWSSKSRTGSDLDVQLEPCEKDATRWCTASPDCDGTQYCRSDGYWSPCFCTPTEQLFECEPGGITQPCENGCGKGEQRCEEGVWQPCSAFGERTCHNGCASGFEYCVVDEWLPCDAPVIQSCSNGCAEGTQICKDGAWTDCDAPTTQTCSNTCGVGKQRCVEGHWTECDATGSQSCLTFCGTGEMICREDEWGSCSVSAPVWPVFKATVRDFKDSHPDMERDGWGWSQSGIVMPDLGPDEKPVYSGIEYERIEGAETFDQWYRDVPGVNKSTIVEIPMTLIDDEGLFRFTDSAFFPIDDMLFGNEDREHNFHFTLELVTRFRYIGGEVFTFSGDDDLWVFINHKLAIDLGGEHEELIDSVYLDESSEELDIVPGEEYPLHLFFAERHTVDSHFTIETTIEDWDACP